MALVLKKQPGESNPYEWLTPVTLQQVHKKRYAFTSDSASWRESCNGNYIFVMLSYPNEHEQ